MHDDPAYAPRPRADHHDRASHRRPTRVIALIALVGCWRDTPAPSTAPPTARTGGCIPSNTRLALVHRDDELVACSTTTCWAIDRTTGAVGERLFQRPAGHASSVARDTLDRARPCYRGLCWTPLEINDEAYRPPSVLVAFHADGRRAAIADDPLITIFDLATKKELRHFEHQLTNGLANLWFANELIAVRGDDAGPASELQVLGLDGASEDVFSGLYEGGVGIGSRGQLVVNETAASQVSELALGKSTKRAVRAVPAPPDDCDPMDPTLNHDDPEAATCVAFFKRHYAPYWGATLIDDNDDGYVGLRGTELFTLDRDLVETSRITLAACR